MCDSVRLLYLLYLLLTTKYGTMAVWTATVPRRRLRQGVARRQGARLLVRRPAPAPARRASKLT